MLLWIAAAFAVEGMWLPEQAPSLAADLAAAGIELSATELSDHDSPTLSSIVNLGFCSGSFVSPDGLVLTNHHCAEGFLGLASTPEADHLARGFTAPRREEELPAGPSARMYVVQSSVDVTAKVRSAMEVDLAGLGDDPLRAVEKRLVSACERPGHRCELVKFDGGRTWRLIRALELRDVRIVQSPPVQVGYFGGDLDNFEWPRHDGDYALLRAWVGPNGRPADPSPNNVPYRPPSWLRIDPTGVEPGEPVLVLGFPAETWRYMPHEALRFLVETADPLDIAWYSWIEPRVAAEMATATEAQVRLRAIASDLANERKYVRGVQDNLASSDILGRKEAEQAALIAWIDAEQARATRYDGAIYDIKGLLTQRKAAWPRDRALDLLLESDQLRAAWTAWRWANERELPLHQRSPGFLPHHEQDAIAELREIERTFWAPLDEAVFIHGLEVLRGLPVDWRLQAVAKLVSPFGGEVALTYRKVFAEHPIATTEDRLALMEMPLRQLERCYGAPWESTDEDVREPACPKNPWMELAIALDKEVWAPNRRRDELWAARWAKVYPLWREAQENHRPGRYYPDANGTLRFTWGRVEAYTRPDGTPTAAQTWLGEMVGKHALDEYEAPPAIIAAAPAATSSRWADAGRHDVPIAFLSSVDTTRGNSGSATLNARGELVGVVFDGNYESMAADWMYDPQLTRTLHVDVRYILWLLSVDPQAGWILAELGM